MEMALLSANSIVGYKLIAFNYKGNREQFLLMLLSIIGLILEAALTAPGSQEMVTEQSKLRGGGRAS
jgi:hypothetical protein